MTKVDRVRLHPQGPEVSRMIYGTWRINDAPDASTYTPESLARRIEHCLQLGVTTFDLADIYGGGDHQCERLFGAGLAQLCKEKNVRAEELRAKMELVAKCDIQLVCSSCPGNYVKHYDTSAAYLKKRVEESMELADTCVHSILAVTLSNLFMKAWKRWGRRISTCCCCIVQIRSWTQMRYVY
jgi:predicted oxidoreductase